MDLDFLLKPLFLSLIIITSIANICHGDWFYAKALLWSSMDELILVFSHSL